MENFNEKYDRLTTGGVTRFRYPIPGKLPGWMSGMEDALRRAAGEPTSKFMTPDEINKLRQSRGETPYTRAEFETFGIDPAGPRNVPVQGWGEPPKQDPPKQDPPKQDPPKQDPPKQDPPKQDPPKQDPPKQDPPKQDPPKQDPPREEPVKPTAQQTPSQRYIDLIRQKKTAEAEALGKEIWAQKYKDGFKSKDVDVTTDTQKAMIDIVKNKKASLARAIPVNMEAYDLVLDYLLSEGHVDTVEEAHYVMMQLDSEYIRSIVEGFPATGPLKRDPAEKLKLIQDPKSGERYYIGPGGGRLTPGQVKGVMGGELMVKKKKPNTDNIA